MGGAGKFDDERLGRRPGRLKQFIHNRAQSPQVHLPKLWVLEEQIVKLVARSFMPGAMQVERIIGI